ncbi:MAG TPA: GNAT family N-acetyltransferase [Trueperaceae bacterium]
MSEIRDLGRDDLDLFLEVRSVSFPPWELDEQTYREIMAKRLPYSRAMFVNARIACVITVYPMTMYLAGTEVPMGGLAGVASAPQYRRRGHIRNLLLAGLKELHEDGVGWCLEYPFDPRFYSRLGWQSVPSSVDLELPIDYLYSGQPPAAEPLELSRFAEMAPIYEAWAKGHNFCLTRREDPREAWKRLVSEWWLEAPTFLYRFEDAYLLFALSRDEGRTLLTVEDYAYRAPRGRSDLLAFIGSMQGQVDAVRLSLPADDPLALDHRTRHSRSRWPMQARIVDLSAALGPLASDREESFTLRLHDASCPWNEGTFSVRTGPDGTAIEAKAGAPDVELRVETLPLLLTGLMPPRAALQHGAATGSVEALDAIAALGGRRAPFMARADAF